MSNHRFMLTAISVGVLGLSLPAAAAPAEIVIQGQPGSDVQVRTEKVTYGDLNLEAPAGAKALLLRIRGAAWRVCGQDNPRALGEPTAAKCEKDAMSRAVADVDRPLVTQLFHKN
jgi:UrcA family protein